MPDGSDSLLLVLPMQIVRVGGALHFETQACNGLQLWLDNFARVTLALPVRDADRPPPGTSPLAEAVPGERLEVVCLPTAWTPLRFARALPATVRRLAALIDAHRYLHFAIGGAWGDWGAVGAIVAARRGRRAAVWTDRVESEVMHGAALRTSWPRRAPRLLNAWLAARLETHVIRRSALGLFHGKDTYDAYHRWSANPQLVHDIHLSASDRVDEAAIARKAAAVPHGPLRIVYAGRAHADKGVDDWVETLALAAGRGVAFDAMWYGDGPERDRAVALAAAHGLAGSVRFPGPLTDRQALLGHIRAADLFLFCHKTRESPRCLVEALLCGTPIVGYRSAFPEDLISVHGGGRLSDADPAALADIVVALDADRTLLGPLARRAAQDGWPLIDAEVFRHRADLMKRHL